VENAGLKWILHGNEYWYAEAESRRVRKEHGGWRKRRKGGTDTFPKFPAHPRETATPLAKQEGHLKVAATEEKKDAGMDPACGRPAAATQN
jgi:hypothetical protein